MRRELGEAVTAVLVYYIRSVERELLVGVDADHQVGDGGLKTIVIIILITGHTPAQMDFTSRKVV